MSSYRHDDYHIGIVCALPIEQAAVRAMLDEDYGIIKEKAAQDHNTYFGGRIHDHIVVVACLPAGIDGVAPATAVVKDMIHTFQQLRFCLMVGIGGGIPNLEHGVDIRLGDVVVSQPDGIFGGVVHYDKGKAQAGGQWVRKGSLNAPPKELLSALSALRTEHELNGPQTQTYLFDMLERRPALMTAGYAYPGDEHDILRTDAELSVDGSDTTIKNGAKVMLRTKRPTDDPHVHYGTIASGNQVVKNAAVRNALRQEYGALCVEMEAAGLMNDFPCLVIRGICDYADENKNDLWHRYAAATAAAFMKELLSYVSVQGTSQGNTILHLLGE